MGLAIRNWWRMLRVPSACLLSLSDVNHTLAAQGALTATSAQEEVVAASEYRALQNQVRELQRLLGKKTLEAEILKEALEVATGPKKQLLRSLSWPKGGSR